ncbi:MAG TPA: PAS domain S-box protein [Longimicrobium sp.]|nr:PAS domain S-box protein [Longimicrobium sp.]
MTGAAAAELLPCLASAAISAGVGVICWRRRSRPGAGAYAVVALGQAACTLGFVLELLTPGLAGKLFWDNAQFLALAPLPAAMMVFALRYTGRPLAHPARTLGALTLPAAAFAALAFTDRLHGLVRAAPRLVAGEPFALLVYGFTPWMLVYSAWVLGLALAACVVLSARWIRTHPLYRAQADLVLAGVLLPWAGGLLTLTLLRNSPLRDLTPLTFGLANLLVAWGLFRRRLFDVGPVARHVVVESLGDAVYVLDAAARVVDLNPAARAALGGAAAAALGRPAAEVLPLAPGQLPAAGERVEVETGTGGRAEVTAHPLRGPGGEEGGRVVMVRDVSAAARAAEELRAARDGLERRVRERTAELEAANAALREEVEQRARAETELREGEARFRAVVESLSEAIILTDTDGIVRYASPRIEAFTGYTPAEMVGRRAGTLLLSGAELRAADERLEARRRGESGRWEVPITRKDGSAGWFEVIGTALHDPAGRVTGGIDAVTDVTERRRADDELRAVQERFRMLVETVRDYAIVALDPDGYVVSWNAGAERITGYAAEEILGRHASVFYPPAEEAAARRAQDQALREGRCEMEGWRLRSDGSRYWGNTVLTLLRDGAGRPAGFAAITRDLTDRREAEEALRRSEDQLRHAQKMEAVGRLAGGIAHDFNNLLMTIGGHAQLLLRRAGPGDPARPGLEEVKKAADRAAALTRQLLAFSRRQVLQPRVVDLGQTVAEMRAMLEPLLGRDVELSLRLDPGTPRVRADASQVEQVVMNLVVNARDALPRSRTIRIETGAAVLGDDDARRNPFLPPGRYAELRVIDDGCGMDEATLERIFEPFFTTKEAGKGTGLGLSTVYGIVKQSGGYVVAESAPGAGSVFRVYLPPVEEPAPPPPPSGGPTPRGWETVLLVEDEDAVRGVVREALRLSGYEVLEARGGAEALTLAEGYPGAIHLLLSDVVMPGLDGPETARRVLALHPEARVLYLSGHPAGDGLDDSGAELLHKPVSPDALARRVREVLDRPAGALR